MTEPTALTLRRNRMTAALRRRWWDLKHPRTRFLFCATTGRSGTGYLARLFENVPGCSAHHQSWPIMHSTLLKRVATGDLRSTHRTYWVEKAIKVRKLAGAADWYVETNHLFIKTFAEYAVQDFGPRLVIIHLRRDPVAVAASMLSLGQIPGFAPADDWYLDFHGVGHLLHMPEMLEDGGRFAHDYFRCLWYWFEIEARIAELRSRTPEVQWELLDWSGGIHPDHVTPLLRSLGMPEPSEFPQGAVNRKPRLKHEIALPTDRQHEMKQELEDYIASRFGFSAPPSPSGKSRE